MRWSQALREGVFVGRFRQRTDLARSVPRQLQWRAGGDRWRWWTLWRCRPAALVSKPGHLANQPWPSSTVWFHQPRLAALPDWRYSDRQQGYWSWRVTAPDLLLMQWWH
jgi:hypothetical protein